MLRYDQFLVGCRTAARSSLSMREKQQRPGLSPTAVIKAQVPREVRSQRAAPIRGSRWRRYFDIFFFFAFFVAMAYFLLA
jgi:hypothetical protein